MNDTNYIEKDLSSQEDVKNTSIDKTLLPNGGRRPTTKILNNSYFDGNNTENFNNDGIVLSPEVEDNYKETYYQDPVLLQQRQRTNEHLYDIFKNSPFWEKYGTIDKETGKYQKIPKEDVAKVFYYCKNKLNEIEPISAFETVIAINEFFEFNYDYVVNKVLSPRMKSEIYAEYYNEGGMKSRMNGLASVKLF